ncbi:DUF928 domain-containing protein [Calothrix sp. FACHB-1219]|uniref:DUF928 domain-containing protein n=1 Tax=unclassified Calothrix TaxID=2619626 RepID=UPI0016845DAA|nr:MULTISPECIES: DUF928 domain-containing protein [unclassified Calothrix]MBD2206471.1 DUF928 domain-containing protein [Calothrix sp. FACHB-168]MBD2220348.1 DUF928 domain-containing protein [Calothrix sp. FACHB-1219]
MKLILASALVFSSTLQYPVQVTAQTKLPANTQPPVQPVKNPPIPKKGTYRPVFVPPQPPAGLSTISGRRSGMGSRNDCPAVETPLTALVPFQERVTTNKQTNTSTPVDVWGLTTSERPMFWFYVPYKNVSAEFVLQDSEETEIYKQENIALTANSGVIGISLPSTVTPLEVGKTYRWFFKIRCHQQQTTSVPIYVEGDIQRVKLNPSLEQQLQATTDLRQKIAIYAANGIWFDALTKLGQLRFANSNDASLAADWQSLLQSGNLENIAAFPLVNY